MAIQKQIGFWIAALLALILVLYIFSGILLPFVAGLALAYLLDPLADRLEKIGLGRLTATLLILIFFVLFFTLVLILLVPLIAHQLGLFIEKMPVYVSQLQNFIAFNAAPLIERIGGATALADVQRSVGDLVGQGARWIGTFLQSLWSGGQAIVSVFALLVLTPVIAFYLLVDWDRMLATMDSWIPRQNLTTVRRLAREMDAAIAGFLRGQATVCIILGTFYAVGLSLVGLNFGALIGMTSGLLSFIPYVGSMTGLLISLGVAGVQFWPDWVMIAAVLGVFLVGQFLEGNILSPKLVGASVGLHPVWLMFSLFAFGSVFGFVGLFLAVPLAAAVGVLTRFALQQYMASPIYRGEQRLHLSVPPEDSAPPHV
jgi:predicted PurR-regulated permease PerM